MKEQAGIRAQRGLGHRLRLPGVYPVAYVNYSFLPMRGQRRDLPAVAVAILAGVPYFPIIPMKWAPVRVGIILMLIFAICKFFPCAIRAP